MSISAVVNQAVPLYVLTAAVTLLQANEQS